jgi:hypothetical protein
MQFAKDGLEKLEIVASFQEAQTAKEPVKNIGSNIFWASV